MERRSAKLKENGEKKSQWNSGTEKGRVGRRIQHVESAKNGKEWDETKVARVEDEDARNASERRRMHKKIKAALPTKVRELRNGKRVCACHALSLPTCTHVEGRGSLSIATLAFPQPKLSES